MATITSLNKDFSQWYNDIVLKSGLACYSPVKGCMIIKPYGYALWENIQKIFDQKFKSTGHQNAYFPLLIPKSFFSKEAKHVDGFAKECAVVTHYRLKNDPHTNKIIVDEDAKLEEELIIRPTSETIIWNTYREWIQSHRDLPIKLNQWCNILRWEMRTRLFLRTTEFLWQEGHTAHASKEEAIEETLTMLNVYTDVVENFLGISVIQGTKTEAERFAGAEETYCIEALMKDGKALQAGTSHFLGQNFAKAFDVKFNNKNNTLDYVWATSWGVSTRLIGAIIMSHSDDDGLVLPPKIAPIQVVIIPIIKENQVTGKIQSALDILENILIVNNISYKIDLDNENRLGWKLNEYDLKGIPIRIIVGEKDMESNEVEIFRRDTKEKTKVPLMNEEITKHILFLLEDIQSNLFKSSKDRMKINTTMSCSSIEELNSILDKKGGFVFAYYDGTTETEKIIQEKTKATARCIPLNSQDNKREEDGKCIVTGKKTSHLAIFARAY